MAEQGMLAGLVQRMPSGAFAFVMATGIVSTAYSTIGWSLLSLVLLVIAGVALVVLAVMLALRLIFFPTAVLLDTRDPARAFGFFTVVAAINVVGVRLYSPAQPALTIVLAAISVPLWLVCTYGLPSNLILRPTDRPVASDIDGSWFLWVVGTQSLAIAAATIGSGGDPALAAIAVALWGIGVLLYIMLATLVTLRLLTVPSKPSSFTPAYWIYMGATAITVLAGSRILHLPADVPVLQVASPVLSGLTYLLWGFGLWWVPLLIIFGAWRHLVAGDRLRYEGGLWSIVFPLGMYSVASMHFGTLERLPLLDDIGRVGTWIAGAAWLAVTVAMVWTAVSAWRGAPRRGAQGAMAADPRVR